MLITSKKESGNQKNPDYSANYEKFKINLKDFMSAVKRKEKELGKERKVIAKLDDKW